jgi:hypothetical protein
MEESRFQLIRSAAYGRLVSEPRHNGEASASAPQPDRDLVQLLL